MTPQTSKLRRLFQALSLLSAMACVLLIVLWVRSYWWRDEVYGPIFTTKSFTLVTTIGSLEILVQHSFSHSEWGMVSSKLAPASSIGVRRFSKPPQVPMLAEAPNTWGFGGMAMHRAFYLFMPLWFLAGATGLITVTLYFLPTYRFSLRTLLVAMTLMAMVLGLIAWAAR